MISLNIMTSLKNKLIAFHTYWFRSFEDPLMWVSNRATTRDTHLKNKYSELHTIISTMTTSEIIKFLQDNNNNMRLCISIILLLDQVSRQLYRDNCKAFKFDSKCQKIAKYIDDIHDMNSINNIYYYCFWILVFEHSTNLTIHKFIRTKIVNKLKIERNNTKNTNILKEMLLYLDKHTVVLKQFGNYPKRKLICKQPLTKAEKHYVETSNKGLPF